MHKSTHPAGADHSSPTTARRDYPTPLHHFPSSSSAGGGVRDVAAAYVQKALVQSGVDRDLLSSSQRAEITKSSVLTERSLRPDRGSFMQKQHQIQQRLSSTGLPRPESAHSDHQEHTDYNSIFSKLKLLTTLQLECLRNDTDIGFNRQGGDNDRNGDSPVASGITPHPSNHVTYYDMNGHAHTMLGNNSILIFSTFHNKLYPRILTIHNTSYFLLS